MVATQLIGKISRLSLRAWVLIAGLVLALFPAQFSHWFGALNQGLFTISSYLVEAPKGGSNIGLILVPDAELRQWQQDINSSGKLGALLSNILHSSESTVGVILPAPLDLGNGLADRLLQRIASSDVRAELVGEAADLVGRKQLLLDTFQNRRVVVGIRNAINAGQKPLEVQPGVVDRLPVFVQHWLWPMPPHSGTALTTLATSGIEHYPLHLLPSQSEFVLARPLDTQTAGGDFLSYFLFGAARAAGEASDNNPWSFFWQRDRGLTLGDTAFATSPDGTFLAFNTATERLKPLLNEMSLDEGLARGAFPDYVLITSDAFPRSEALAAATYSLLNGKTAHRPWWFVLAASGTCVVFTLLALLLLPRLSLGTSTLLVALVILVLLLTQIVLTAVRGWWLPLAGYGLWLMLALVLMRVWSRQRSTWLQMQGRVDEAGVLTARIHYDRGAYREASQALEDCSSSQEVLQTLYDIGSAYAARRQYRPAIETLQLLSSRRGNFRDTEQKIKALEAMVTVPDPMAAAGSDVDATVVIDKVEIDRPVLGRYELRRELGRGAMGIVYLGFDPRIARQVAIKTLTYNQFDPEQLDDIKSRFFREAEAAGRLNHPNIVSVFDVGEESDLAFIAMDFVDGKPLSAFVNEQRLLPVFEVYRIMAEVSAALEYAHGSQIVHRDIKPGNIMYNPSPYQVKVTDFGIARLVDDSRTSTGEILGSPLYMSPEQLKGKRVDFAADVFSLGVTFYQLLTGRLPFAGDNLASLTYEIIHGKHKGVRTVRKDLPSSASRIINQCLQKEAGDRYDSAGELSMVLKKALRRDFPSEARKAGYL